MFFFCNKFNWRMRDVHILFFLSNSAIRIFSSIELSESSVIKPFTLKKYSIYNIARIFFLSFRTTLEYFEERESEKKMHEKKIISIKYRKFWLCARFKTQKIESGRMKTFPAICIARSFLKTVRFTRILKAIKAFILGSRFTVFKLKKCTPAK